MTNKIDLTIGITNYNAPDLTLACIESVKKYTKCIFYEIIVVDNKSIDDSVERLSEADGITLIQAPYNSGFTRASNVQLREARGEYFILLNNDTELLNDALSILVEFMREHSEAGAIGPQLYFPNGRKQYSYGPFHSAWRRAKGQFGPEVGRFKALLGINSSSKNNRKKRLELNSEEKEDRIFEIHGRPRGCAFMVNTDKARNEIGEMDERFYCSSEEVDWAFRFIKAGYKNYYVGTAKVMHHWFATCKERADLFGMIFASSYYKYCRKHYGIRGWVLFRISFVFGACLNFFLFFLGFMFVRKISRNEEMQSGILKLKKAFMVREPIPLDAKGLWKRSDANKGTMKTFKLLEGRILNHENCHS